MTTAPTERAPGAPSSDDERLGGSRSVARSALGVPAGFVAEAVAAGFSAPVAIVAADAALYVAEAGHPRRTPSRLFRVEPASGAASLLATLGRAADETLPWIAMAGGRPLVTHGGRAWQLRSDGELIALPPGAEQPRAPAGLIAGSWLADDGWYLCDPGPRLADGSAEPGAGIVWRLRRDGITTRAAAGGHAFLRRESRPATPAISVTTLAAGLGVGVGTAAIVLALYYRARRRPSAPPALTER